jgi:predicted alpha/beta superfamily hydrolase
MVGRIIALIAISSIISLVSTIHGHSYGSLITGENGLNSNQVQRYYTIASLINNQTSNKEIMIELKSQIENSDPFKSRTSNNEGNTLNLSSTQDVVPNDVNSNDVNSNDVNSNDVNSNDDGGCKSDCADESKPIRDDIPFELPSIPFP